MAAPTTPTTSMRAPSSSAGRPTRSPRSPVPPSLAIRTALMMVTTVTSAVRTEMRIVVPMMAVAVSVLAGASICIHSMLGPRCGILEVVAPRSERSQWVLSWCWWGRWRQRRIRVLAWNAWMWRRRWWGWGWRSRVTVVVVVPMGAEEWEWERWHTWSTRSTVARVVRRNSKLQRNGLWTFPEWTRRLRGRSDSARVGARGISRVLVLLRVLEFVGQHCEVRVQFDWESARPRCLYTYWQLRDCGAQWKKGCLRRAYMSTLDKRSHPLVLP